MHFYKTYTDEKQIENSNIQLNIEIITLLVLKENAFKVDVNFQISRFPMTLTLTSPTKLNLNLSLCLNDYNATTIDTRKLQEICLLR